MKIIGKGRSPVRENYSLSDFEVFYEDSFPDASDINVQDAGNYYLLTIDYPGLDDADAVAELVSSGKIIEWLDEEDHEGSLIDAASYLNSLEEDGFEKGYFQDKEYAEYFESGRTAE